LLRLLLLLLLLRLLRLRLRLRQYPGGCGGLREILDLLFFKQKSKMFFF
jgi:hypothetical protein